MTGLRKLAVLVLAAASSWAWGAGAADVPTLVLSTNNTPSDRRVLEEVSREAFRRIGHDVRIVVQPSERSLHAADSGEEVLGREGIQYAGLGFCPTTVFRVDDLTIGFTAFAPNTGTLNFNDHASAARIVGGLDSICDIVIVSFHGGAEGSTRTHVTRQDELFVGENRGNPYRFARTVIDAGADIVFGHGPHVTRAVDLYRDRLICYSLGNFATYGRFNLSGVSGIAPMVRVTVNRKGEFQSALIRSIRQPGEGGPVIDEQQRALREIIQLTRSDIPEAPLLITMEGRIHKKPTDREDNQTTRRRTSQETR